MNYPASGNFATYSHDLEAAAAALIDSDDEVNGAAVAAVFHSAKVQERKIRGESKVKKQQQGFKSSTVR